MTEHLDALSEDALTGRCEAAGEPSWLRDRRLTAYKRYLDQSWPDSHQDEYWRSTPFHKRFDTDAALVVGSADAVAPESLASSLELPSAELTIVDGGVVDATVPADLDAAGVVVTDLAEAADTHRDLVEKHLGSLTTLSPDGTGADEDRTVTVNDTAWTAGAFVYVPPEVEVEGPIGVQVHVTQPGAHLPRVLVVLGHHAKATVYIQHTGAPAEGGALVDEVVEAHVGDAASLAVVSLQEWSGDVAHFALQKAAVSRDGTYRHLSVNIGGATVRLRPEVDLVGEGASCFPLGIYFADEGQHFDLQPYIRHIAPHASSDVLYKGALQGASRTVFRGNVLVGHEAVGTDTNETNRTLILTEGARADSTPFLEIFCADVKAGHGSATGQLDARQLFYLEARGIPREQAVRLIVYGFFREVLDRLDAPGVRERAMAHIEQEIESADLDRFGVGEARPASEGVA